MTPNTKKVLLFWNEVPENLKVYTLVPEDQETLEKILSAHNQYTNTAEETPGADFLSEYLVGKEPIFDDSEPDAKPFNLDEPVIVVISGFIM